MLTEPHSEPRRSRQPRVHDHSISIETRNNCQPWLLQLQPWTHLADVQVSTLPIFILLGNPSLFLQLLPLIRETQRVCHHSYHLRSTTWRAEQWQRRPNDSANGQTAIPWGQHLRWRAEQRYGGPNDSWAAEWWTADQATTGWVSVKSSTTKWPAQHEGERSDDDTVGQTTVHNKATHR
jgi:hypothetical protein